MTVERVPLDDAVQRVFDGDIRNASAIIGLLAAARARSHQPPAAPARRRLTDRAHRDRITGRRGRGP